MSRAKKDVPMKQRHALIIGGTSGAGRVAVARLHKSGYIVSVIARRPPTGAGLPGVAYWTADITDRAATAAALGAIVKRGPISCVMFFQRFRGDHTQWDGEIDSTLTATKNLIDALVEKIKLRNCAIVVVNSIASRLVGPGNASLGYHVAKAGLAQLVRYYAASLGARGIRINAVTPGYFLKSETKSAVLKDKRLVKIISDATPLGRLGRADDVVDLMEFLCGDRASFITGQDIVVDGGLNLQYPEALLRSVARE